MTFFGSPQPETPETKWRQQLNQFAKDNQQELAALAWGLFLERGESDETLGIDLNPTPHFVYCPKTAIEELNRKANNQLQEILGVVDAHQPEKEVLIIGIGNEQLKLIQFEPEPPPPACFEQVAKDVDTLLEQLQQRLTQQLES
ncbi:hypothetical protein H6F98_15115 [Microcoleus sp. FACHB-SPT15]|uniref:beta-carboxysome assembly chaperone CcmS n=1 Tax=Microcoleus sp. FACHB-SPT15 TaxID=2692830 RepID=UPI001786C8AC|nr:hypothetical protein [Microcoleus sp. FACHB-SPT15]MBD1806776.1 hypothetical protein [Microcoleus sp. FACHB-SPT15]